MRKIAIAILAFALVFPLAAQVSFQLELFGSYAFLNPADLNLESDYLEDWVNYFVDRPFNYYEDSGFISNLEVTKEGEFARIKSAIPFGAKFKVIITENFAVALGVDYLSRTASSAPSFNYDYVDTATLRPETRKFEFASYELFTKVINPNLTFHYIFPELADIGGLPLTAELYAGAGIIIAEARISDLYEESLERPGFWYQVTDEFTMNGKGKGMSANFGARLNLSLAENVGIFLAGDYLYAKVKKLKGDSSYKFVYESPFSSFEISDSWSDQEWFIAETSYSLSWGDAKFEWPTNNPNSLPDKVRDFELNLSGFRLIMGLFFRF